MLPTEATQDIVNEGLIAHKEGKPLEANPYHIEHVNNWYWYLGWYSYCN